MGEKINAFIYLKNPISEISYSLNSIFEISRFIQPHIQIDGDTKYYNYNIVVNIYNVVKYVIVIYCRISN